MRQKKNPGTPDLKQITNLWIFLKIFVVMALDIKSVHIHEEIKFVKPNNHPVNDLKNLALGALLFFVGLYHLQSLCS